MLLKVNSLLLIFFGMYTSLVYSNDGVFVVQVPDDTPKELKVYWNAPTKQCKSKGVPFDDLYEKFGIIQNTGDLFERGDRVVILYDPGLFPALLINATTGEMIFRNGGVPHQGNLTEHLIKLEEKIGDIIPDADFNGIAIIDQEVWRPIYRWHWGGLAHYKNIIIEIERNNTCSSQDVKERSCCTDDKCLEAMAKTRFEAAAQDFMHTSLNLAKKLRPKAQWGYYAFPYCFNREIDECAKQTMGENEQLQWLWKESTALFPSVYPMKSVSSFLEPFIRGNINEAARIRNMYNKNIPILSYWWYRYSDGGFFSKEELTVMLDTFYYSEASGIVIWGKSADMETADKCKKLRQYVYDILGPTIAEYTKPENTRKGPKHQLPTTQEPHSVTQSPVIPSTIIITDTPEIRTEASSKTDTTAKPETTAKVNINCLGINVTNSPFWTKPLNDTCGKGTSIVETIVKETYVKEIKVIESLVKDTYDGSDSVKETKINETFTKESSVKESIIKETFHGGNLCGNITIDGCYIKNDPSLKTINVNSDENESDKENAAELKVGYPKVSVSNILNVDIGKDKDDKIATKVFKGIIEIETIKQDVKAKGNSESLKEEKIATEEIATENILDTETRMMGNPSEIETSRGVESKNYNHNMPTTHIVAEITTTNTEMTTENTENYSPGSFWDQFATTLGEKNTETTKYLDETTISTSNTKENYINNDLQNTTDINLTTIDQYSIDSKMKETATVEESNEIKMSPNVTISVL